MIASFVAAMSRASTSGVRHTKAFFFPSGLDIGRGHHQQQGPLTCTFPNKFRANTPNQSINLDTVNVVYLLDRFLDLPLICFDIDDEDQRVVLLNLLHCRLGVQGVYDDLELVQPWRMGDAFAGVLRIARERGRLGAVERDRRPDLLLNLGVVALKGCLLCVRGLFGGRLGPCIHTDPSDTELLLEKKPPLKSPPSCFPKV